MPGWTSRSSSEAGRAPAAPPARRRARILLAGGVWALCLWPLAALGHRLLTDPLVTNPIDVATDTLGDWALRLLLASLTATPLRLLSGWSWPVTLRRRLGLFAFAYAGLHFLVWIAIDHVFDWPTMLADVVKRPYVTVGLTALALLLPLAATSTAAMVRRLGATAWRRLHRLAYAAAALGVLHYLWLAKVGVREPYLYLAWLALVLGVRAGAALRRQVRRARASGMVKQRRAAAGAAEAPRGGTA